MHKKKAPVCNGEGFGREPWWGKGGGPADLDNALSGPPFQSPEKKPPGPCELGASAAVGAVDVKRSADLINTTNETRFRREPTVRNHDPRQLELFSDVARAVASRPRSKRSKPPRPTDAELQAKLDAARARLHEIVILRMKTWLPAVTLKRLEDAEQWRRREGCTFGCWSASARREPTTSGAKLEGLQSKHAWLIHDAMDLPLQFSKSHKIIFPAG